MGIREEPLSELERVRGQHQEYETIDEIRVDELTKEFKRAVREWLRESS